MKYVVKFGTSKKKKKLHCILGIRHILVWDTIPKPAEHKLSTLIDIFNTESQSQIWVKKESRILDDIIPEGAGIL